MNSLSLFLAAAILPALAAEPRPDVLRLSNGELEGHFAGLSSDGVLRWKRDDGVAPLEFKTDKIRQIILHGGTSLQPGADASHVTLSNGDRIPGHILTLDADTLTLETEISGTMIIPRDAVVDIAPSPFGGRLIYAGPFSPDGWEIYDPAAILKAEKKAEEEKLAEEEKQKAEEAGEDAPKEEPKEEPDKGDETDQDAEEKEQQAPEPSWRHSSSKWYFTKGNSALRSDVGLPDQSIFRFKLEWRSRPSIAVAFNADFALPEPAEEAKEDEQENDEEKKAKAQVLMKQRYGSGSLSQAFGNAFVLTFRNNYIQLQRCGFNKKGEPFIDQIRASSSSLRFEDTGETEVEIRCDNAKSTIALFLNGEFSMQWDLTDRFTPDDRDPKKSFASGTGIGFQSVSSDAPIRVSQIVVAEWNGMPDSARSLENDERDVVLLTNGTDRFSGQVVAIEDDKLELKGAYAELSIPLEEVAEIHFATSKVRESSDSEAHEVRIHFQPIGRISGIPGVASNRSIKLKSTLLGELEVALEPAVIIEFQSSSNFLNYWDEDL